MGLQRMQHSAIVEHFHARCFTNIIASVRYLTKGARYLKLLAPLCKYSKIKGKCQGATVMVDCIYGGGEREAIIKYSTERLQLPRNVIKSSSSNVS